MNEGKNNTSFIIGVAIGAALTYLFTTKNGQRIKEELIKEGSNLLAKLGEGLEEVEEKVPKLKQAEKKVEQIKDEVIDNVAEVEEKAEEVLREVPQQVAQVQKKGRHFFFKKHPRSES